MSWVILYPFVKDQDYYAALRYEEPDKNKIEFRNWSASPAKNSREILLQERYSISRTISVLQHSERKKLIHDLSAWKVGKVHLLLRHITFAEGDPILKHTLFSMMTR